MKQHNTPMPPLTHEICQPVAYEYGQPPDLDLMIMDGHGKGSAADAVVTQLVASHSRRTDGSDIEDGTAARRARDALDCGSCVLHGVCQVEEGLEQTISNSTEQAKYNKELAKLQSIANMLVVSSSWLAKGRIADMVGNGFTPEEIYRLFSHPNELTKSAKKGSIDVDAMRGGIKNEFIGFAPKKLIPEISESEHFDDQMYPVERITTDTGHIIDVIDASVGNQLKEAKIPASEYAVLAHKFMLMIANNDSNKRPQIFNADSTKLSIVHSVTPPKGTHYFEVRMAGKNRMYIAVTQGKENEPSRIVIFGAHGGDDKTQEKFIRTLLNTRTTPAKIPAQRSNSVQQPLKVR